MGITSIAGFAETLLSGIAQTKTVQMLEKYAGVIALAVLFKEASFSINGYTVSVKQTSDTPQHLTLGAAFQAVEHIEMGTLGTFVCGSIEVDVQRSSSAPLAA